MRQVPSISVVFAAYNEELSIESTICRAVAALEKLFDDFEIIIVDDKSTDSTGDIADKLAANDGRIRVLHNEVNMGQGTSLLKGFARARCDLITHNAIDYPFDLEDLKLILPLLDSNDIVVATRTERPGYTLYRRFLSWANLILLNTLFDLKLRDYNFVQVYKRPVIEAVRVTARSTGFVTPELLIRSHCLGFKIAEVELKYLPREIGIARSGNLKVVVASFKDLLSFWFNLKILRRDAGNVQS